MSAEFRRCGNTNLKKSNFAVQLVVTTIRIRIDDTNLQTFLGPRGPLRTPLVSVVARRPQQKFQPASSR